MRDVEKTGGRRGEEGCFNTCDVLSPLRDLQLNTSFEEAVVCTCRDGKKEILGVGWDDPSEQVPREQGSPQRAEEVGLELKPVLGSGWTCRLS